MKKLSLLALAALLVALILAACGGGGTATQPTQGTSETQGTTSGTQPTATTAVAGAEATSVTSADVVATEPSEADLSLDSISGKLTGLKSYKTKLDMRFSGKDAQGLAVNNSWIMEEAFIVDPAAQHVKWTSSEATGDQTPTVTGYEMITIGQTTYSITQDASGTSTCMAISSADATPPTSSLSADMWGSVSDARYVGTDTVNGVRTKHYVWKEGSLTAFGFGSGKGETWVAIDGGYVVKQTVEATGKGLWLAAADQEGTTTWAYDVTDANGSFTIDPPVGCESAAGDIPVMANATDRATIGDMITYSSPSAMADVVSFYRDEMPKAGWQPSGTPTEMEGYAMFEFTKEGKTASVTITYDASTSKTSVFVSVTKQ